MIREIDPVAARELIESGWCLVDVRTPEEFRELHAAGAVNLPLDQFTAKELSNRFGDRQKFVVICLGGVRSKKGCEAIIDATHIEAVSVAGGTQAWVESGLPTQTTN